MSPKKTSTTKSTAQQLIGDLRSMKGAKIQCSCCGDQADALKLRATRQGQRADRLENAATHAQRVNFGNFAERLIPATPDFPGNPSDYRHLGSPIDYISFHGITNTGVIDSIDFIDAKAGKANLKPNQKLIANAVAAGRVSVRVIGGRGTKDIKASRGSK
jgi:predicted Holliday junction resolvase-like endonuclease